MIILGLDYGSKTVGVAITDALGLTVLPVTTIKRDRESKLRKTLAEIEALVEERRVEKIVLGLPLNMDGTEGERVEHTREFAEKLRLRVTVPIEFTDERLTTMEAAEILDENGIPRCEQKKVIDQVAAQLILEQYLREHKEA
ncbi:MAG TPA: Holliday junction resolvase RuvX [Oribacterium sp.]|jgi:putative Holliday junction resolvase|nr:Holliday junction resolvase RuvX [Oribacterium sp.]